MTLPQDYKQAVETLCRIEQEFDTASLQCGGMTAWPVIRLFLWNQLISPLKESAPREASGRDSAAPKGFTGAKLWAARAVAPLRWNNFLRALTRDGKPDVLLLSNRTDYSDKVGGALFNRHIDPLYALANRKGFSAKKVEISHPAGTHPRYLETAFIPYDRFTNRPNPQKSIESLAALQYAIDNVFPGLVVDADITLEYMNDVLSRRACYLDVLSTLRPRAIFLACYYSQDAMAMISAAKRLHIRTVDIQHGKQGLYHGMYNHWSAIPKGGYDLLPDYFWVWGEESKRNILLNNGGDVDAHIPLIGGNLWHGDWKRGVYPEEEYPQEYERKLKRAEIVILFSAQPLGTVETVIPPHVREAITKSPPDWLWLIRTHPHQKHLIPDFKTTLDTLGANYDIDTASNSPLLQILKTINVHLTCWSSVTYEAIAFGKRSIIVHETGQMLYKSSIDDGTMDLALEEERLISLISSLKSDSTAAQRLYIETSQKTAEAALAQILD